MLKFLKTAKNYMDGGKYGDALTAFSNALDRGPDVEIKTGIYYHMAICRLQLEQFARAVDDLETALDIVDELDYANKKHIYELLWIAYRENLDCDKLKDLFRMFLSHGKDVKDILGGLLSAYDRSNKWEKMARILDEFRDVKLDATALRSKISCFTATNRMKEAIQASREYIERFGEDKEIYARLMTLCYRTGDAKRGLEYYKKAVAKNADPKWRLKVDSMLLGDDVYYEAISDLEFPAIIADMRRNSERLRVDRNFVNTPKPFRKIRLGYLSADLRPHPVGHFLLPVMTNTVKSHSFIKCYSLFSPKIFFDNDSITAKFRKIPDAWADVQKLPDADIERMFLDDKIDVAFDMMCHSEGGRLLLYARRLAPVQISWIGFPVTTAVAAMDYIITDRHTHPAGAEKYCTEKLLYMPDHYLCHTSGTGPQVEVEAPAFTRNDYITFACFHNLKKVTDKTLRMWRRILEQTENSVLKVMGRLPKGEDGRDEVYERFRKNGMPMDRVSISPQCRLEEYFAAYNGVDIMLDTYPFSGATTTFDALKMGRPIITLAGERHVTRVGYSILKKIGFEELAAFTEDLYVEKAVGLANDTDRLLRISNELPGRLMDSPLVDHDTFRKNYEKIIRDAWVAYCADKSSDYDYNTDSLPELQEQLTNATAYFERKLDAGEEPDDKLVNEYHRIREAFLLKCE